MDKLDTFGPVRLVQLSARHVNKIATRAMLHVSHTSPQDMRRLSLSIHNIISHVLRVSNVFGLSLRCPSVACLMRTLKFQGTTHSFPAWGSASSRFDKQLQMA